GVRTARINATLATIDAGLRDGEELLGIGGELGIRLRRSGYDSCRSPIGRSSKRQKLVKAPQRKHPSSFVTLAEAGRPRQATIEWSDHEWYALIPQEESERTWQDRCHRQDAQNDV